MVLTGRRKEIISQLIGEKMVSDTKKRNREKSKNMNFKKEFEKHLNNGVKKGKKDGS